VLQLLVWCITATGLDACFACNVYSCVLLGFWGIIWLIGTLGFARGWSLGRVVAATGWLPPVGCGIWLLWLSRCFGG
jgi:hypothetical protein